MDHHSEDAHLGRAAVVQLPSPQVDHVGLSPRERSESNGERGSTCEVFKRDDSNNIRPAFERLHVRERTKVLTEISRERSCLLLPGELQKSGGQEDRDQVLGTNLENGLRTFDRHE